MCKAVELQDDVIEGSMLLICTLLLAEDQGPIKDGGWGELRAGAGVVRRFGEVEKWTCPEREYVSGSRKGRAVHWEHPSVSGPRGHP